MVPSGGTNDGQRGYGVCLIGGSGRSGTTLLRQILGRHPLVASLPSEARFLADPDGIADFYVSMSELWSPYAFDTKVRRLEALLLGVGGRRGLARLLPLPRSAGIAADVTSGRRGRVRTSTAWLRTAIGRSSLVRLLPPYWSVDLERACPSYASLVGALMSQLIEFTYRGRWIGVPIQRGSAVHHGGQATEAALRWFCREFVRCVCNQHRATQLIEDTPLNLLAFPALHELLPETRLIHVYRDPRDVVASYLGRRWSPSGPVHAASYYVSIMRRWDAIRPALPDGSYVEVGLSALVDDPARTLRQLCDFLALPWDPVLLDVDLSRSNRGRWRNDLPLQSQPAIMEMLAPFIERYGD